MQNGLILLESELDKRNTYTINLRAITKITKQRASRPRKKIKLNIIKYSIKKGMKIVKREQRTAKIHRNK